MNFLEIYDEFREVVLYFEFKHRKPKAELMLDEEDDTRELGKKKAHDTCYLKRVVKTSWNIEKTPFRISETSKNM